MYEFRNRHTIDTFLCKNSMISYRSYFMCTWRCQTIYTKVAKRIKGKKEEEA